MESTLSSCGYCWKEVESWDTVLHFKCDGCGIQVHIGCIKSPQPSPLLGDTFFYFKCQSCGEESKEEFHRRNISWRQVVILSLYNLHKTGQGRRGYFHWRVHVCAFIDLHWHVLFGPHRKKTGLWFGTVAGTLSSGCPVFFESGVTEVEQGYWKLVSVKPPQPVFEKCSRNSQRKRKAYPIPDCVTLSERHCRKSKTNLLSAAIELKEKRATMTESKRRKSSKQDVTGDGTSSQQIKGKNMHQKRPITSLNSLSEAKSSSTIQDANQSDLETHTKCSDASSCVSEDQDSLSVSSSDVSLTVPTHTSLNAEVESTSFPLVLSPARHGEKAAGSLINIFKTEDSDDNESDLDIDIESMIMRPPSDMNDMRPESPDVNTLLDIQPMAMPAAGKSPVKMGMEYVKTETFDEDSVDEESEICSTKGGDQAEEDFDASYSDDDDDDDDGEEEDEEEEGEEEDEEDLQSVISHHENIDSQSGRENDTVCNKSEGSLSHKKKKKLGRPRKRRRSCDLPPASPPQSLKRISLFEEGELLNKLNAMAEKQALTPELAQLRRKLLCNQTNREYGLPVFDLDDHVERVTKQQSSNLVTKRSDMKIADMILPKMSNHTSLIRETRDLDRFMMKEYRKKIESRTYSRFCQRLVGLEDKDLKPFISPYTTRALMPFIWRNYNMKRQPLKMRLLQEIKAYPHRKDPTWKPEPTPPIDYCYIRPEHIPSVNALCREFFWPGIDMSECLQYPDYSCVVLYRKIVIGFAFMVPDRGYNEAYISFIFTHPEWRKVGIASVMLYHLIQTCMGKDVLLHVSASSPAMLLYQKFGFKAQELILNFYYKYFPLNSPDSPHAFLMRLNR